MRHETCKEIANIHSSQSFRFDAKRNCMWLSIYQILFVLFTSCDQTLVTSTFRNPKWLKANIEVYTPTLRQEKCIFVSRPSKKSNYDYIVYYHYFAEICT